MVATLKKPTSRKSKAETIAEAGLSTSTANRYEQLAGGQEERVHTVRTSFSFPALGS
jgi:ABC-type lipoprotein export system ATPase subunit